MRDKWNRFIFYFVLRAIWAEVCSCPDCTPPPPFNMCMETGIVGGGGGVDVFASAKSFLSTPKPSSNTAAAFQWAFTPTDCWWTSNQLQDSGLLCVSLSLIHCFLRWDILCDIRHHVTSITSKRLCNFNYDPKVFRRTQTEFTFQPEVDSSSASDVQSDAEE